MKTILCLIALIVLSLHHAHAQEPRIPALGSRVRVTTDRSRTTGTLESIDSTKLVVRKRGGETVTFDRASDFDLDVSAGRSACADRVRCVGLGFLGGGLVGVGAGGILASNSDCAELCGLAYLITVPAGALLGTIVGAVLPGERWSEADLPALTYVVPDATGGGRIQIGVRLSF